MNAEMQEWFQELYLLTVLVKKQKIPIAHASQHKKRPASTYPFAFSSIQEIK